MYFDFVPPFACRGFAELSTVDSNPDHPPRDNPQATGVPPQKKMQTKLPLIQRMRNRLPSKRTSLFLFTAAGIIAAIRIDNNECQKIHSSFKQSVAHLAEQPMQPTEFPRKLLILCVNPIDSIDSKKVGKSFREHSKCILDAAAVDYELHELKLGELQTLVEERLAKINSHSIETDAGEANEELGIKRIEHPLQQGVVVVGRASWRELLQAFDGKLNTPINIGYIPFNNTRGFRRIPAKFQSWFYSQLDAERMGIPAVDVALDRTIPFTKDMVDLGKDEEIYRFSYKDKSPPAPLIMKHPETLDYLRLYGSPNEA
jgi:hypothetical protein